MFLLSSRPDETSSVKNAFLIGEINFQKKFNTFENDTHEMVRPGWWKSEIQLKSCEEEVEVRSIVLTEQRILSSIIKSETRKSSSQREGQRTKRREIMNWLLFCHTKKQSRGLWGMTKHLKHVSEVLPAMPFWQAILRRQSRFYFA